MYEKTNEGALWDFVRRRDIEKNWSIGGRGKSNEEFRNTKKKSTANKSRTHTHTYKALAIINAEPNSAYTTTTYIHRISDTARTTST